MTTSKRERGGENDRENERFIIKKKANKYNIRIRTTELLTAEA